jgi:thiosulfate/3-mercaptopyruvate sulfurtransferase
MNENYARPDVLVSVQWVADHLDDPDICLVESNEDVLLYNTGHIPGAVKIDWFGELNDPLIRDYLNAEQFANLLSQKGISPDTTVIFYGDKNNWWAAYAFWVFQLFGHTNAKLMDGGRKKWQLDGRPLVRDLPARPVVEYPVPIRDDSRIRAFRDEVMAHVNAGGALVDVRSPGEYSGELLHMPDYPQEGSLRGGHIPGARNIPWARAANDDGTFKSAVDLKSLYEANGITPDKDVIAYCRIGERSSHTWFVLTYLLGYPSVHNYDGSWTEWGNLVGAPVER